MAALAFKPETVSKVCSRCGERKLKYEFAPRGGRQKHLLKSQCRECTKAYQRSEGSKQYHREYWHRKRKHVPGALEDRAEYSRWYRRFMKYGITREQYFAMLETQQGKCAICGDKLGDDLRVDHDHSTGAVRELLCNGCNAGVGFFKEDVRVLKEAVKYLEKHSKG